MTTPNSAQPSRPSGGADAALFDAINAEHGTIYGYGLVSAHTTPEVNDLVADALAAAPRQPRGGHRGADRTVGARTDPGGRLPDARRRQQPRHRRPNWRCGWKKTPRWPGARSPSRPPTADGRKLAVTALTDSAVLAARWREVIGSTPATVAFPGGSE